MSLVEPLTREEVADALAGAFRRRLEWQMSGDECDSRMSDAIEAVLPILNRPHFEDRQAGGCAVMRTALALCALSALVSLLFILATVQALTA